MSVKEEVILESINTQLKALKKSIKNITNSNDVNLEYISEALNCNYLLQEKLVIYKYIKENTKEGIQKELKIDQGKTNDESNLENILSQNNPVNENVPFEEEVSIENDILLSEEELIKEEVENIDFEEFEEKKLDQKEILPEDLPDIIKEEPILEEEKLTQIHSIETLEKLSALSPKYVVGKLQRHKIVDLKKAIKLNQRFQYANELFDGNMEAFNRVVNELNHMNTRVDAEKFIELQLRPKYNWDNESITFQEFLDLVDRKFL